VRSQTALDIFEFEGQVPESRVKGEPAYISTMVEYAWCEWVKFCDTSVGFPDSKVQLGRELGAAIGIGPAMVRKIPEANGDVMYRTSVRSLTPDSLTQTSKVDESTLPILRCVPRGKECKEQERPCNRRRDIFRKGYIT
jgi:hypothetical protein